MRDEELPSKTPDPKPSRGILRDSLSSAWTTLAWAARFFRRHYLVVLAFGVVASAQRFIMVLDVDGRFGFISGPVGDQITQAVRSLFAIWAAYVIVWKPRPPRSEIGDRLKAFFRRRGLMPLWSALILVALILVLDIGIDLFGATLYGGERLYVAIQLAIKNVTIIPFITIWFASIARFALTENRPDLSASPPVGHGRPPLSQPPQS